MAEATISAPPAWESPASDPNDETFGDVIESATLDAAGTPADVTTAGEFDAVLLGEPYDGAVIGRRGAREGPGAIREALAGVKTHHVDAGPVGRMGDLGDVAWPTDTVDLDDQADVGDVQALTESVTAGLHATDALPVFLGGDNSLTVPNVAPLLESGSVGVLNFDAHLDVREPADGPSSGTPYRQLHDRGLDAYAVVGARHFETSTTYVEWLQSEGGAVVTAEAVGEDRDAALDRALRTLSGVDHLYVSVDLDVLDAPAAPGVSAPTPGGLTARELFACVREACDDDRLAGFEVVECAPGLDDGTRTARAAARTVAHALAGYGAGGEARV
ncbi:formiminoglutamase [Halovivax asiaticus JCM 14624]|uniref:Formimidoylglutamase n=1 Tax=Halovivax asiaticus JCM 14624 TaxID=1227490 RepID=M0BSQ1_9EURY|nr:formimidoylglutamase [Halovivax asiaticus]ELZ12719.1 formiminoglutamase [Halovivax asiaticus JCM 14624]